MHARKTATVDEWNMPQYDGPARGVVDEGEDEDVWDEGEALEAIAEGEAEGEHAEEAEYDLEELIRASEVPLPNPMMPSFWAVLFTMGVATAHALLLFAQRWSVVFARMSDTRSSSRLYLYRCCIASRGLIQEVSGSRRSASKRSSKPL